ncbi:unnamed protein product [Ectocarpus sp. 12 AP-2014]
MAMMMSLVTENKIASAGAAAIITGVVLLLSASTVDTGPVDNDDGSDIQLANIKKRKTILALGGSVLSIGILAQVYDQYTRFSAGRGFGSSASSAQMSPAELSRFQDRVSAAAAKLRKSIAETSGQPGNDLAPGVDGGESAAELAARASAQISSFIQNYS